MSTIVKNTVVVELYDLPLTKRKDDRYGRVVTTKSLTEDDLIDIAVSQRTDLNANTLRSAMQILKDIAAQEVAKGASVRFGLTYHNLGVSGIFTGDQAKWDPAMHSLEINSTPTNEFRSIVKTIIPDVRGMAASGMGVNTVTDISTGMVNSKLTRGNGVNVRGKYIKIKGNADEIGLRLIHQQTNEVVNIPVTSLLVNEPSRLGFIIPHAIPEGDYKLSICTQFSASNKSLKETRTYTFEIILNIL